MMRFDKAVLEATYAVSLAGGISPSYSSAQSTEFAIREAQFGEGYSQRISIGLNSVKRTWELTWEGRDKLVVETITRFLHDRRGAESFLWTMPGETTDRKWVCQKLEGPNYISGGQLANLSATFVEVFDL